ncbi:DNA translocase FtsK 4TM domain-containing protein [Neoehrlichia mikurensis]|uniref:DNA translocase FtsK 4TM domain-containing protein n=1 Tax=Neoehrlichia mikurensis TaxID=89586 RepID=A0A9Q9BZN7_9RICK|nr:DNA translocase FtsK 4TM domain-containing protein [Neoehrlichia mikurensis]QXK92127.1 DNA translocase FtsK 4TM domain-containing protein [Neoehrlichia mikurensis]QXK92584.1 DNA translocase FtsK 4TM domain-containing protein [Neoehrlichia mikurensis]QXK93821.1 DNA translocase FtsK 4TM domain-containing protein [Neoehrlichia mikurensis]UTO55184.1 DNA translocase FtsK 4TM domain-containing protein [Neoehrlichia mikurensis]UTO56104.1 DNA translocase FtsK 4TM domain-containing protein [Neoehrli
MIKDIFYKFYFHVKLFSIFCIAGFICAIILTYNVNDTSFNTASSNVVMNIGGKIGSYCADILIQYLGAASFCIWIFVLIYGIKELFGLNKLFDLFYYILAVIGISGMLSKLSMVSKYHYGGVIGIKLSSCSFTVLLAIVLFSLCGIIGWKEIVRFLWIWFVNLFKKENKSGNFVQDVPCVEQKRKTGILKKIKNVKQLPEYRCNNSEFILPAVDFLSKASSVKDANSNNNHTKDVACLLDEVLKDFGIYGKIINVRQGPVVTLYEFEPSAGTKSSRVIGLSDDIARSMSALSARISVIPGKNVMGIELPNHNREIVMLRDLINSKEYRDVKLKLPIILGKSIDGEVVVADLTKMPHLLIAGTTGAGKSVAINTMILSLLYSLTPEQCKMILIDPKVLELSIYDSIPHLLTPVVTESKKAIAALKWVVGEMENRYRLMSAIGVRNIIGYNDKVNEAINNGVMLEKTVQTGFDKSTGEPIFEKIIIESKLFPYIVVIVDEMADLMLVSGKEIESSIQRLSQMARAAGIHIIMATQRPSVDVITGVIKANFPTRISFAVTSKIDSRTILGEQGAEQLLGMGDMLYMVSGGKIIRVHGAFVSDSEVQNVVNHLKKQGNPSYMEDITQIPDEEESDYDADQYGEYDDRLYGQAVSIVLRDKKTSVSYIQRQLRIGYNRAANLIERMEREGILGPAVSFGKREILTK